jgi:hypothetical protein
LAVLQAQGAQENLNAVENVAQEHHSRVRPGRVHPPDVSQGSATDADLMQVIDEDVGSHRRRAFLDLVGQRLNFFRRRLARDSTVSRSPAASAVSSSFTANIAARSGATAGR